MKFAKQKLLILVMLFALPHAFVLALIETPELSSWVLNVALKVARLRTGLKIDATGWDVNPVTFSAKIEGVVLEHEDLRLQAPRVQVWLSPVALFLGKLHFSVLEIADAQVQLDSKLLPEKNLADKKELDSQEKFLGKFSRSYPDWLGEKIEDVFDRLAKRNISFDDAELSHLELKTRDLHIGDFNLELNNLQQGQARLEWEVNDILVKERLAKIEQFSGTISLLKAGQKSYQVYIGQVALDLTKGEKQEATIKLRGAWPGQIVLDLKEDWKSINDFLKQSPDLSKDAFGGENRGSIDVQLSARLLEQSLDWVQVDLQTNGLILDSGHYNNVKSSLRISPMEKSWDFAVKSFLMKLDGGPGVESNWVNSIELVSMKREEGQVDAVLSLTEASLCGIMLAVADPLCQVGVAFTGNVGIKGSLDPVQLRITPDFKFTAGPILNDPYLKDGEVIVNIKPGVMKGQLLANDKRLIFEDFSLSWEEMDPIEFRGDLVYTPTRVNLRASLESGRFDTMFKDLVDFKFSGHAKIDADIFYDHSLPREKRTEVNAMVRSKSFRFEDQDLGTLSGPLKYLDRKLLLGPFQLRNGGGSGVVHGSLVPTVDRGPYLSLVNIFNRFEYVAYLDEKRENEAFRGFVSGRAILEGHVNSDLNPENKLVGNIAIQAKNLKAFDIPFESANLEATYENNDLIIKNLDALKDGATLKMKGLLSDKGGSELKFNSGAIPLKGIEIEPKLSLFERGTVKIDGFWRPNEGWGVDGEISGARIAGANLDSGNARLRGDNKGIAIKLAWPTLDFNYLGKYVDDSVLIDSMEVKLKDQGIYAGFAYLGDWESPRPVETTGELAFQWQPSAGYFSTKQLKINAPHKTDVRPETVLDVEGSQSLVWKDRKVVENSIGWQNVSRLDLRSATGDSELGINAILPLGLMRLFVPELDARFGTVEIDGSIPLSPHFATLRLSGKVRNGILKIPEITGELEGLSVDFEMQRSQVQISEANARAGSGGVGFRGVYKIDFLKPAADILVDLRQAELVLLDDVPGVFTGELQIRGDKMPYLMSGKINVAEALYTKEFDGETEEVIDPGEEPALRFDLDVTLMNDSAIRNSIVSSNLSGEMTLAGNSNEPLIRGDLVLANGTIHANQVDFKIIQSRIQFYGEKENVPIVSLRAGTNISYSGTDYKIEMNARGPGSSLAMDFSSDPPLPKKDIVSLLAFGVIRQDDNLGEENDDLVTAAQAEAFQTIFGQAIGNSLSKSTGFDVRLKASTSQAGRADNVPKVSVMRRLSDRVTARFARSLDVNNPEKDLQVDYQLLNNVNLSGVWESPTPEDSSVGVDLRFRFEIE